MFACLVESCSLFNMDLCCLKYSDIVLISYHIYISIVNKI